MQALKFEELRTVADAAIAARQAAHEAHFIRRARERFGVTVSPERYRGIIRAVEEVLTGTRYLGPCDDHAPGRTLWRVRFAGGFIRVVYDETTGRLVTCLPYRDRAKAVALPTKKLLRDRARTMRRMNAEGRAKHRRLSRA